MSTLELVLRSHLKNKLVVYVVQKIDFVSQEMLCIESEITNVEIKDVLPPSRKDYSFREI
jgi:hypothetical protein